MRLLTIGVCALALAGPALAADAAPEIGRFGFDVAGMDRSVKPGDDFNDFANGSYIEALEIPADRSGYGPFYMLDDLSRARTRTIIETAAARDAAPGSDAQKVGDFFASFMDAAAIEAKGLAPLRPELDAIAAVDSRAALSAWLGRAQVLGLEAPVQLGIGSDDKDPDIVAVSVYQGGLGLPDRDYYSDDGEDFVKARAAYLDFMTRMLTLAGFEDASERAAAVMALETKIAAAHWSRTESRQAEKMYNPSARSALAGRYPGLDWEAMLAAAGGPDVDQLIVAQTGAVAAAAALMAEEPLGVWRDYFRVRLLSSFSSVLPEAFVEARFALSSALSGQTEQRERWKRGVDATTGALGEAVGVLYVAEYFPPEAKAKIDALVKNVIAALDERLSKLAWMAPETRAVAREKLTNFTPKIGYPEKWRDYTGLEVVAGEALANLRRAREFEHEFALAKLGRPVDRSEWFMTPMTVNAYAYPSWVEVVFPASILQPPFFDPAADDAVNYAAIGAVIGHEILHHFDDQGRKFDKDGKLKEWWTKGDVERFSARSAQLVSQYEAYEPLPGKTINGALTLGENIADVAGLQVAWDAWQRSLGGKPAPVIDGFTGAQRFFLGYAQVWRGKFREKSVLQRLTSDPHSPGEYRAQTVRNLDEWYAAFDVKPGDALYLAPEDRVKLW